MTVMSAERLIVALPTYYGGVKFKSALEARWAMYFDEINVAWRYEDEGYALPSGPYLPDFWLPVAGMHAEVKPDSGFSLLEVTRCRQLATMTGYPTVLLDGPPRATSFYLVRSESPNEIMNGNAQGGYFGLRLQDTQVEIMQVTPGLWPRVKSAPNVNTRKGVCETITVDSTGRLQDGRYWVVNGYASLPYGSMWTRIRPKENALFHEIAHRVARTARRTNDGRLVKS